MSLRFGEISSSGGPAILVHGGAWDIPFNETRNHEIGMYAALEKGIQLVSGGSGATGVVAAAVASLEDHPAFDAGRGAVLNRAGFVELDAGIMDGTSLAFGAVAACSTIRNPIRVAEDIMRSSDGQTRLIVGEGADNYAKGRGFDIVENEYFVLPREQIRFTALRNEEEAFHTSRSFSGANVRQPGDTVGCVVLDSSGHLGAGTSTGGAPYTIPGRVGDSPIPGAGYYANDIACASATGWGEAISAYSLCVRVVDAIASGESPGVAAAKHVANIFAKIRNPDGDGGTCGIIVLDRDGNGGWAFTTPRMARAGWTSGRSVWTAL